MRFLGLERFFRKEDPGDQLMRDLEATGAPQLLAKKAEELKCGIKKHSDSMSAWMELSWPKQDPANKARKLRVVIDRYATKVLISREGERDLVSLYEVYDSTVKPYSELSLQEKIEIGTRLAQATPPTMTSNSTSSKV